jgi:hypothetical protein
MFDDCFFFDGLPVLVVGNVALFCFSISSRPFRLRMVIDSLYTPVMIPMTGIT